MTNAVAAVGSLLTAESASMNSPPFSSSQASCVSGAIRYERVAVLEAALTLKRQRNRKWWAKAVASVGVIGLMVAGLVMCIR